MFQARQLVTDQMYLSSPLSAASPPHTNNAWSRFPPSSMAIGATTPTVPKKGKKSDSPPTPSVTSNWSNYGSMGGSLVKSKRLLTIAFDDRETVVAMPSTFEEVVDIARNWVQPPEGAVFSLRMPTEYANPVAARSVQGPYLYIHNDQTFQIATEGYHPIRIEIVSDAPPPPEEPESPPPPPVLVMPCNFDLELVPGLRIALDTVCNSEDLDMSRSDDGTLVEGSFWGCLKITHTDEEHTMEFKGTRYSPSPSSSPLSLPLPSDLVVDHRTVGRLAVASRPSTLKATIKVNAPVETTLDLGVVFCQQWALTSSFPPPDNVHNHKMRWIVKAKPGGALEHVATSLPLAELFYEATPDTSKSDLGAFIKPSNSFAMPLQAFMGHLSRVLDSFGLSLSERSAFMSNNYPAFSIYRNIAFRFMTPTAINRAMELFCTISPVIWTRIFFMWRGLSDEELSLFAEKGRTEKEAQDYNWKAVIGWREESTDKNNFTVTELSAIECT